MAERSGRMIRVGEAVRSLMRARDRGGGLLQARAAEVWEDVVGPEIAHHTVGMSVRAGELNVHVDSHSWAAQLNLMSEELRDRVNSALGENAVRTIRFTVSRAVDDARVRKAAERDAGRRYGGEYVDPVPLTEAELREIEQEASVIEDEGLREAAIRARVRDREVKKGRGAPSAAQEASDDSRGS